MVVNLLDTYEVEHKCIQLSIYLEDRKPNISGCVCESTRYTGSGMLVYMVVNLLDTYEAEY